MFLGTYQPHLMEKGRVALPKKIREQLGGLDVILTVGFEACIFGFSEKGWEEATKPEIARPLFSDKHARDLRRRMYSEAVRVSVDGQGRIVLPLRMTAYAGFSSTIVVVGAGDHFEIWEKTTWEAYRDSMGEE